MKMRADYGPRPLAGFALFLFLAFQTQAQPVNFPDADLETPCSRP